MCQNYTYDVQTQVVSAFGGVSATDREVGSNHCPDEKGTERHGLACYISIIACSNHCPDEKGTERSIKVLLAVTGSNHCR